MIPYPQTVADILALPELVIGERRITVPCKCGANVTVVIPELPPVLASFSGENDPFFAIDDEGEEWCPVLTAQGWRRRRMP